jgi:glycosyltransferase involved in cell wall biosynthesis
MDIEMNRKCVIVVWFVYSRRAETIAAELGGQIHYEYENNLKNLGLWLNPLRYLVQGWKTWRYLEREKPEVVLVQAPPVFAPLIVALWCRLRGKGTARDRQTRYIIDAHTGTFYHHHWRWALRLLRPLSRHAIATLVTNKAALDIIQSWGARGLFLIDGLPELTAPSGTIGTQGEKRVALISTFSDNEPIEEVFIAARQLRNITFYITGNPKYAPADLLAQQPDNVILTGFLRGGNYTALLKNVHGLIVLTKEEHDLSCGAYEALAVSQPVVASDVPEMRRLFTGGFVYVNNTPQNIAEGIQRMLDEREVLITEVIGMRAKLEAVRQPQFSELVALIES